MLSSGLKAITFIQAGHGDALIVSTEKYRTNIIELWYAGFNHKLVMNPGIARKGIVRRLTTLI